MLCLVLALSLSGGVADRPSTDITATPPAQGQVQVAEGATGVPPRTAA